jgi:hypothetical protein
MERAEVIELLSHDGLRLLDSLPPYERSTDVVRLSTRLRADGNSPSLVRAVLTQARLRARAADKFGEFASRMLFTEAGLEQATRLRVAAVHAGRFRDAGIGRVADLGCGIGGDAMAMAAIGLEVEAVERDEVTAALASYNLAPFPDATVSLGEAVDASLDRVGGVYLDPARRTAGHDDTRRIDSADYSPPMSFALDIASRLPTGIKLGPGFDRSAIPDDAEAQWVSESGQLVEMGLWFGAVARAGVRRSALVLSATGVAELTALADSPDEPSGELGDYLYEPDPAVIRARLIGDVARELDGRMLDAHIAYITADAHVPTAFATAFRVLEELPSRERDLAAALRSRRIGTLEIKKRGADVDPAALRKRLSLKGTESATIVMTRTGERHRTLLVERV